MNQMTTKGLENMTNKIAEIKATWMNSRLEWR